MRILIVRCLTALAATLATVGTPMSPGRLHGQVTTAPRADSSAVEKVRLAEGIYLFRAPSALDYWTSSNSVVIVNENDVTVFDSNARPSTTRLVIAEIRRVTSKPVRTLINSHWHMDHWFGNEEYARAFPGVQIIATTETRDYMRRMPAPYFVNQIGAARVQARLDTAIRTGKLADGTTLTADRRQQMERDAKTASVVGAEIGATRQRIPTLAFNDSLVLWSGDREFRLFSATGDATGSAILYLPRERLLITGDVLVRREDGRGAPPWTTNSYKISPWLHSLRQLETLDVNTIVPGQGPPLTDKSYLRLTVALFESIIAQVNGALERGAYRLEQVQASVNLEDIRRQFTGGDATLNARFDAMAASLIRKAYQEAHDGLAAP